MNDRRNGVRLSGDPSSLLCQLKRVTAVGVAFLAMLASGVMVAQAQAVDEIQAKLNAQRGQNLLQDGATAAIPRVRVYPFRPKHQVDKTSGIRHFAAPAGAHLTYNGGPVVSTVQVVIVLWGNGSYIPQLTTNVAPSMYSFFSTVTNDGFMDLLSQYSTTGVSYNGTTTNQAIGHGGSNSVIGTFTIVPSVTGSTIDDSQIQPELLAQIAAGHLPSPTYDATGNANTIYMIYFPPGITITQGGSSSCVSGGFCAYHSTVLNNSSQNVLYGVLPDMQAGSGCSTGCGASSTFGNYTSVSSHELAEAITDAAVGLAGAGNGPPLAWYDNTNGEIGDICNAQQGTLDGYTVQLEFSNAANNCVLPVSAANDFAISASPSSVSIARGASGNSTISTSVTSGSAATVSLAVSGAPSGVTASLSPTSVTAGGGATLTITVGATTAAGSYTLTVTGTEGSKVHSASVTLTVPSPTSNDFAISASPASVSIAQGASGNSTISTSVTSGSAATVSLAVSGAPSGVTASLTPASVTAGASAALNITVGATAAAGSYTLTVTGTEGTAVHSASVALTVTSVGGGGGGITNGGFESGSLSGWTATGASESVSTTAHSGTYSARLGSTSPTNGDSSISQTFTAPSGATGISFWYRMSCPDTVSYDWATATLKDNTAGTTKTLLTRICTTNPWTQVSGTLIAGHSYTLTLTSHDDNYAGDPTFTLFDDVAITTGGGGGGSGITNGGFESGSTGWTTAGTTSIAISGCHGGSSCAQAGSTSPTNGDSSFSQTFTVPAGKSQLSIWYKSTCPDTVTYDWVKITLNSTTVVPKTCTTNAWTNVTAPVTAGSSYTLTLTNHDDNYPGDPTFTLFDDVTLN